MSSDESNEMAEEKMPEKAADTQPAPRDEGAEVSTDAESTPQEGEEEVAASPSEERGADAESPADDEHSQEEDSIESETAEKHHLEADSSSENQEEDGEESAVNSQSETAPSEGGAVAGELAVDPAGQFSEERIERILDIELPVNISFGSTKKPLSEVLKLGPGALLELDRAADEPVLLKVNNRVFAKGEIVDVDGYYGVQITEISSPAQRIASLGDKV
jgi:flagellar motor switch protein FliN